MKILALDIETAPNVVYCWGLYNQNIGINQIDQPGYTLCWAAKWVGEERMMFSSIRKHGAEGMLERIHRLLSEADAVLTYNGLKFDLPTLNKEFLIKRMAPPSPYKHIDLYQVAKRQFRFASNKLDFITTALDIGSKIKHQGHELWTACMAGDKAAWKLMEEYNRGDVTLLEDLYVAMRPWVDRHPSYGAVTEEVVCPKCGSDELLQRGYAYTAVHKYKRYQCKACGGWARGNRTVLPPRKERIINAAA